MKHVLLLVLSFLASHMISAQSTNYPIEIAGLERYNSYEKVIKTDNLPHNMSSNELQDYYYKNLSKKQYQIYLPIYDHDLKRSILTRISKKAGSGYLYLNQKVAEEVGNVRDTLSVQYNYNANLIDTAAEVQQLIKLRRRQISSYKIDVDLSQGVISVYVYDKKYHRKNATIVNTDKISD